MCDTTRAIELGFAQQVTNSLFWQNFLPNFVSTTLGVVIGIPVALWLNRQFQLSADKNKREDEQKQLRHGLITIREALEHNQPRLVAFKTALESNHATFDIGLDMAAWEAARDQIIPFLRNPELQRRVAFHFDRLATLTRLSATHLDMTAGIGSAIGGIEQTRDTLKGYLLTISTELHVESIAIYQELQSAELGSPVT